jgi:ABC-type dipeptide/oligopeptide/nickel transport system permease component
MAIARFLGQRVLYLGFQLLGVVTVTFFLVHLIPGNPAQALAGVGASRETVAAIEHQLGLNKPLIEQYWIYLTNVAHGELGNSIFTGQPVKVDLEQRVPATLELVGLSMLASVMIGIPLGSYAALQPRGVVSRIATLYGMLSGFLAGPDTNLRLLFHCATGAAPNGSVRRNTASFTCDGFLSRR